MAWRCNDDDKIPRVTLRSIMKEQQPVAMVQVYLSPLKSSTVQFEFSKPSGGCPKVVLGSIIGPTSSEISYDLSIERSLNQFKEDLEELRLQRKEQNSEEPIRIRFNGPAGMSDHLPAIIACASRKVIVPVALNTIKNVSNEESFIVCRKDDSIFVEESRRIDANDRMQHRNDLLNAHGEEALELKPLEGFTDNDIVCCDKESTKAYLSGSYRVPFNHTVLALKSHLMKEYGLKDNLHLFVVSSSDSSIKNAADLQTIGNLYEANKNEHNVLMMKFFLNAADNTDRHDHAHVEVNKNEVEHNISFTYWSDKDGVPKHFVDTIINGILDIAARVQ